MTANFKQLETKLIHAGEPMPHIQGSVSIPIFQSATFEHTEDTDYHNIKYLRLSNTPNHLALHQKLASLEDGDAAIVTGSGMAAISTTLLACLSVGDHLLAQDCLYGGTYGLLSQDFSELGLSFDFFDSSNPKSWKTMLRPNTKAIYVEAITNPLMQVTDLEAVTDFAKKNGLISIIDNTFTSPVNFRPLKWGFDLSIHSATKYLNGHSDITAGAVIGSRSLIKKISNKLDHFGGILDPHAAFLLHRGIKTLVLRVKAQNQSALQVAQFLQAHPAISIVNYPGLKNHPNYQLATHLFDGYGGMLSFELHSGIIGAKTFLENLVLPIQAPSLGGVESLITRPAFTTHCGLSKEDRQRIGISEDLIRFSVGIEATSDLIQDFEDALKGI